MAHKEHCCFNFPLLHDVFYHSLGMGNRLLGFFYPQENHTISCTKCGSLVSHSITCLLEIVIFSFAHHMWILPLCYRFGGNTWLWMKAIEWRITTASLLRSWTLTMWPPEGSSWLGPHCRISSQSSGLSSTSSFPQFLRAAAHSNSGLMLHLPWPEKGY